LLCPVPKVNIALQVLCADTQEEALHLASSRNLNRARRVLEAQGAEAVAGLIPADEAAAVKLSEEAVKQLEERRGGYIDGDPEQVKQGMIDAAARYDTNDLSIVTIAYRLEDRIRSLELVAEAFGLSRR
jgi:alkanesulfonate monooxygenase SsuD/methylene tetrahydromethanopterin reductase-like flavin-dependent oxidoreductase (luciferase family)